MAIKRCLLCPNDVKYLSCGDNPNEDYAFNLYICEHCFTVYKEDVWINAGVTVLKTNGEVVKLTEENQEWQRLIKY